MADDVRGHQGDFGEEGGFTDPTTGPPRFPSGYGGFFSQEVTVGDTVDITLPTDAIFDGSGLDYRWTREPNWSGSGLVFDRATNKITGTATLRTAGRQLVLRGNWAAIGEVDQGPDRDTLRVIIRINPTDPLRLLASPTLTVEQGRSIPRRPLGAASGGRRPYRYSLVPLPGSGHPPLSDLGITFDADDNSISSGRVTGEPKPYVYQHRVYDRVSIEPIGQTFRLVITRPRPRPETLTLNDGRRAGSDRLSVGVEADVLFDASLVRGGVGRPASFVFSLTISGLAGSGLRIVRSGQDYSVKGTPTRAGTWTGTWSVRDTAGNTASVPVRLVARLVQSLSCPSFVFLAGQTVNERLPALLNPTTVPFYFASATGGISRLGLTVNTRERTLSGVVVDRPADADRETSFNWIAKDSGETFSCAVDVSVRSPAVECVDQDDISVVEGGSVTQRIRPFTGGTGSIRYSASNLPPGLRLRDFGVYWAITGTAPQVDDDRTWTVALTGTDEGGLSDSCPFDITVRDDEPPVVDPFTLRTELFEVNNAATGTRTMAAALLNGRTPPSPAPTYSAVHVSGPDAPEVSLSGTTLTLALASRDLGRDRPVDSVWRRTARRTGNADATATVTVRQYGRFYFYFPQQTITATPGSPVEVTLPYEVRGGKSPVRVTVQRDFALAAGVNASATPTAATITGTAPASGSFFAVVQAVDALGALAEGTIHFRVADPEAFGFAQDEYRLVAAPGANVVWEVPQPDNADGGVLTMATVPTPLPAALSQPFIDDLDRWVISGTVTAAPGVYNYALIATDASGAEARTRLVVDIRTEGREEVLDAGCGPILVSRSPRSGQPGLTFGSVLPPPGTLGPIRMFRPSKFVVGADENVIGESEVISFDWEVLSVFQGVPILEVDLYRMHPREPYCLGVPNILPYFNLDTDPLLQGVQGQIALAVPEGTREVNTVSVPHEVTAGYPIQVPAPPAATPDDPTPSIVALYRLVALRGGSSDDYLTADWWDLTVKATRAANDVHLSASKSRVPSRYGVMLQWGYRGRQPDGEQSILVGRRYQPVGDITSRAAPPAIDFDPTPGRTDDTREPGRSDR